MLVIGTVLGVFLIIAIIAIFIDALIWGSSRIEEIERLEEEE